MQLSVSSFALSLLWLSEALSSRVAHAQAPPSSVEATAAPSNTDAHESPVTPPAERGEAKLEGATPRPPPTPVDTGPPTIVHGPAPIAPPAPAPAAHPPLPPAASAATRDGRRHGDAHQDRLLLSPTADTHPEGSFYATSYYIVLLQLGYAVSDRTQISVTATPPLGEEGVLPADVSIKTVLLREPHVSVAGIVSASGLLGVEEFSGFLGRVGGVATFCADAARCRLGFSISSNVALAGPASLLFNAVGVNFHAGSIVSLIAEVDSAIPLAEPVGEANGVLGGAGGRLSGRAWGVDLALMSAGKAKGDVAVFPFLAATYRYVP